MTSTESKLAAAEGYLTLKLPHDAWETLDEIDPEERGSLPVISIRLEILSSMQRWKEVSRIGREAISQFPQAGHLYLQTSYGVRRHENLTAAYLILSSGNHALSDNALFHFNMACYECQLGQQDSARLRLKQAIKLNRLCKQMALDDPDLEPMWQMISSL